MFDLSTVNFEAMQPEEQEEFLALVRAEEFYEQRDKISLHDFVKLFWHVLEPTTPFVDNWHIGAICEHLEACFKREIRDLIINIPPRTLKSGITSVFFPAWLWTKDPSQRILSASFAESLALRDTVNTRTLIRSVEYQTYFGDLFKLTGDQDTKKYFANDKRGSRQAFGVGSSIVGQGGDINICDDPNNPEMNEDSANRVQANYWFKNKWYSRYNNPKTNVRILVQQRTHINDVTGYVLDKDLGFEVLKIPFRYEGDKNPTSIGYGDPRKEIGEVISKDRFSEEDARKIEKALGTEASAQLQQRPVSTEGDMFPSSKATTVDVVPNNLDLVRYWDKAFTEGGGAFTAGVLMGLSKAMDYYVLDVVRGQWGDDQRDENILKTAELDAEKYGGSLRQIPDTHIGEYRCTNCGHFAEVEKPLQHETQAQCPSCKALTLMLAIRTREQWHSGRVKTWLEHEPGSMGRDSTRILIAKLTGFDVDAERPTGDKVTRAKPFSSQWKSGNVYILRGDWNLDYRNEMGSFPSAKLKDQVDASSGAHSKLAIPTESMGFGSFYPITKSTDGTESIEGPTPSQILLNRIGRR